MREKVKGKGGSPAQEENCSMGSRPAMCSGMRGVVGLNKGEGSKTGFSETPHAPNCAGV